MRLIRAKPNHSSSLVVREDQKATCDPPVTFVKYRYQHHAAPSGYSRICDYIAAETLCLSNLFYLLGETALRPYCMWQSRRKGQRLYARHDCIMELQFLDHALRRHRNRIYHFIYAEKSFQLTADYAHRLKNRGHRIVGTVHHMLKQQQHFFRSHDHFKHFDLLLTMDRASLEFWRGVTARNNVRWIGNGVDTEYFVPLDSSRPEPRCHNVVFAGSHERDFETLRHCIELLRSDQGFRFDLIGDFPFLVRTESEFANVTVHRDVSDIEYRRIMQNASVLLLPLHASTVCNVVLEAMACGTPVVTTAGGIECYLEPENSIIAGTGDAACLVDGVRFLADRQGPARLAARKAAEQFSWPVAATRHVAAYEALWSGDCSVTCEPERSQNNR